MRDRPIATISKALYFIGCLFLVAAPIFANETTRRMTQRTEIPHQERTAEINGLRDVIKNARLRKEDPKQIVAAIKRLGELRAESAVDDLVSVLTFRQILSSETRPGAPIGMIDGTHLDTLGETYPAIDALFEIGKPALSALTAAIASSDPKSLTAKNATYTVMVIFRDNLRDGVSYLNDQAAKSRTKVAAARLRTAATEVKKTGVRQ